MYRKFSVRSVILLLIFAVIIAISPAIGSEAASYLFKYKEYKNNTKIKYSGVVPAYIIDGVTVDTSKTPSIINERGIAMCDAATVFKAADVKVSYSKVNKTVTFKYNGNKLILYLNTTRAVYNSNEIQASCESYRVKYLDSGKTVSFVPSRFVAETLGMSYEWSSAKQTVTIKTPLRLEYGGETQNYTGKLATLNVNGKDIDNSDYPSLLFSNNALINEELVFNELEEAEINYNNKTGDISISCGDINIEMTEGSTVTFVNGVMDVCPTAPLWIKNYQTGTSGLYIPGRYVFEKLGYTYSWNSTTYKSTITYVANKTGIFKADYTVAGVYNSTNSTIGTASDTFRQEFELPIPDDISPKSVEIKDKLYNNMFIIELAGDYSDFYSSGIENTGEAVRQISILYYPLTDTTRINVCMRTDENNIVLGYKETYTKKSIKFTFDRPKNLFDKIIILDAGHGGTDPGTRHEGYNEKDVNFAIIYTYCKELFDKSDIKVFYSRNDDTLPSLYERAGLAARVEADFFVSVHQNSNNNKNVSGTSVYYSSRNKATFPASVDPGDTETEVMDGKTMARMFLNALLDKLGFVNRGVLDEKFVVVRDDNSVPAVLIECGFMSNSNELKSLVSKKTQKMIAEAIYETVLAIYEKYGEH